MAGVKGNKNALGNKGGGRKGAYAQLRDANRLWEIWTTPGVGTKGRGDEFFLEFGTEVGILKTLLNFKAKQST